MPKLKESFAVLGLSRFGYRVAVGLYEKGASVIAVDRSDTIVQRAAAHVTKAVQADAMDLELMEHLGVFEVDTVIIGLRKSFEAAVLLAHHIRRSTQVKRIIAQVDTERKAQALRHLGVDEVVLPEFDIADRLVRRLATPDILDRIPLSPSTAVIEMAVPPSFVGRSIAELQIRARFGVYVVGIKRREEGASSAEVNVAPPPETTFLARDILLVLGRTQELERFAAAGSRE
jgi:trk system potassium uptake protein TrkA